MLMTVLPVFTFWFVVLIFDGLTQGISDFSLRVALQTLLREYTEVSKSPKENKMYSLLQPAKMRPRRKARKYLYAIGRIEFFYTTYYINAYESPPNDVE